MIVLWLPIAVGPDARLRPDLRHPAARGRGVRGRDLGRLPDPHDVNQTALGMVSFWTTRVGAIFELYIVTRAAALRPARAAARSCPTGCRRLRGFLPFQWTFYFPIEALVGDLSNAELLRGLGDAGCCGRSIGIGALLARLAVRDQALHGGGELTMNDAPGRAGCYLRVGVMNELQYRVNFVLQLLQSLLALAVGLVVLALVYSHTDELNGWSQPELLCRPRDPDPHGRRDPASIQPNMMRLIEEVPRGQARPCADEARGRADARERARGAASGRRWTSSSGAIVLGVGARPGSAATSACSTRLPSPSRSSSARR